VIRINLSQSFRFSLVALGLFLLFPAGSGAIADPLRETLREEAERVSPEDFAVTRIYTDNSGDTRHRLARFDPTKPEGARWTLHERNHEEPSAKYKKRYERRERPPPESYARVARFLAGELKRSSRTETHAIYNVERLGEGAVVFDGEDISEHFRGEIKVNLTAERPFVEEVRFSVARSFKPHFLATVEEGEGVLRFARDEAGRPILLLREFTVRGSKLFGSLEYSEANRYRDHKHVGSTETVATSAEDEES